MLDLVRTRKKPHFFLLITGLALIFISLLFSGSSWTGDFMQRRVIFFSPILALLLWQFLQKKTWLFGWLLVLYLIPIWIAVFLLYIRPSGEMTLVRMRKLEEQLPTPNLIIQTHYVRPFSTFSQEKKQSSRFLWLGQDDLHEIDVALEQAIPVYLESSALFSPYMLMTGNTLHLTAAAQFGKSESQELFSRYAIKQVLVGDAASRVFVYQLGKPTDGQNHGTTQASTTRQKSFRMISNNNDGPQPGKPIFIYLEGWRGRIHRERIDYGDTLLWLWVFVTDRRDPFAWTYADAEGNYLFPGP